MFISSRPGWKAAFFASAAFCIPAVAGAASQVVTRGSSVSPVHAAMSKIASYGTAVATVPDSKPVDIVVYLKFRQPGELDSLVADLTTPGSPRYQQFLTPAEFHERFSPLPEDVARVQAELKRLGFRVTDTASSGLYVRAVGSAATVKAAFHVSQNLYPVAGKVVRGFAEEPVIPASIADVVLHIGGLDGSHAFIHPNIKQHTAGGNASPALAVAHGAPKVTNAQDPGYNDTVPLQACNYSFGPLEKVAAVTPGPLPFPAKLPFVNCGYTPAQLANAYGVDKVGESGQGIRIGIVDMLAAATIQSDLNNYSKKNRLPQVSYSNFIQINPPGLVGGDDYTNCGDASGWQTEETLDLEAAHSLAPNATLYYFGGACANGDPLPDLALYSAIDNRQADIISNSWGQPEFVIPDGQVQAGDQAFEEAAALGITVLVSSGDDADYLPYGAGIATASWPASSSYVTAVGGTSLLLQPGGAKNEYPWGVYEDESVGGGVISPGQLGTGYWYGWQFWAGSGGGRSLFYSQPLYQKGVVPSSMSEYTYGSVGNLISMGAANRVVPDVSLVADPDTGFLIGRTFQMYVAGAPDKNCFVTDVKNLYEFCQFPIGGTSLSSPAMAGLMALVDQNRLNQGKALAGFVNPALYKLKVGTGQALADVTSPTTPLALYVYLQTNQLYAESIDAAPDGTQSSVVLGAGDSSLAGGPGYDEATGLGTPWAPAFIAALSK